MATYEDKEEARFSKNLFRGRSGKLENTVFCFLAPDGKTKLSAANRGPFSFRNSTDMAKQMEMLALSYSVKIKKDSQQSSPALPVMKNFRLGLNVASCDLLPCIVIVGKDKKEIQSMSETMRQVAWDSKVMGRFVFCTSSDKKELKSVAGLNADSGVFVVQPGEYGLKGKVVAKLDLNSGSDSIKQKLVSVADKYVVVTKNHNRHVMDGAKKGVNWVTEIPVTDSGSVRATKRMEQIRQRYNKDK